MIKIDKGNMEFSGDVEVVFKELVVLNIELANNVAKITLDNSENDINNEEYKKIAINVLNDLHKYCVKIIENEILK